MGGAVMRVVIAAVGRLKDGPERLLFEKYRDRCEVSGRRLGLTPVLWGEIAESQAASALKRKSQEQAGLMKLIGNAETLIALDAAGKAVSSEGLAHLLARIRDDGSKALAFAAGGPYGRAADLIATARPPLSLWAINLPPPIDPLVVARTLCRAT